MTDYWLSSEKMTVLVKTDENETIIDSPPIVKRFRGQAIRNLVRWMRTQGGFRAEVLNGDKKEK